MTIFNLGNVRTLKSAKLQDFVSTQNYIQIGAPLEHSGGIHQTLLSVDPLPMFNRLKSVLRSGFPIVLPRSQEKNNLKKVGFDKISA
jgi:hypothetical protein